MTGENVSSQELERRRRRELAQQQAAEKRLAREQRKLAQQEAEFEQRRLKVEAAAERDRLRSEASAERLRRYQEGQVARAQARESLWLARFNAEELAHQAGRAVGAAEYLARRLGAVFGAFGLLSLASQFDLVQLQRNLAHWIEAYHAYVRVLIEPSYSWLQRQCAPLLDALLAIDLPIWLYNALAWLRFFVPPAWFPDYLGLALIYSLAIVRSSVFRNLAAETLESAAENLSQSSWLLPLYVLLAVVRIILVILAPFLMALVFLPILIMLFPVVCVYALSKVLVLDFTSVRQTNLVAVYDSIAETFAWFAFMLALNFALLRLGFESG
jgi:hypothetical protein